MQTLHCKTNDPKMATWVDSLRKLSHLWCQFLQVKPTNLQQKYCTNSKSITSTASNNLHSERCQFPIKKNLMKWSATKTNKIKKCDVMTGEKIIRHLNVQS